MTTLEEKLCPIYNFHPHERIPHDDNIYTVTWEDDTYGYISYYSLWDLNGEISACPSVYSSVHDKDVETVAYCYDKITQEVKYVYLFAHGSQGTRIENPHLPLQVYTALNSHAAYYTPGLKVRCICLANDRCSNEGFTWKPHLILKEKDMPLWAQQWIPGSGYKEIPSRTFNWFQRLFCICL